VKNCARRGPWPSRPGEFHPALEPPCGLLRPAKVKPSTLVLPQKPHPRQTQRGPWAPPALQPPLDVIGVSRGREGSQWGPVTRRLQLAGGRAVIIRRTFVEIERGAPPAAYVHMPFCTISSRTAASCRHGADTPGRTRPLNVPLLGEVPQALNLPKDAHDGDCYIRWSRPAQTSPSE
jgi:hypothetical protein